MWQTIEMFFQILSFAVINWSHALIVFIWSFIFDLFKLEIDPIKTNWSGENSCSLYSKLVLICLTNSTVEVTPAGIS
jgi:hypothetical protein